MEALPLARSRIPPATQAKCRPILTAEEKTLQPSPDIPQGHSFLDKVNVLKRCTLRSERAPLAKYFNIGTRHVRLSASYLVAFQVQLFQISYEYLLSLSVIL